MRGLQMAIAEGWLVQRVYIASYLPFGVLLLSISLGARDMCSFAHDRYRQAAEADAQMLPEESSARMRFRVRSHSMRSRSP
jgi:hypothetical protein